MDSHFSTELLRQYVGELGRQEIWRWLRSAKPHSTDDDEGANFALSFANGEPPRGSKVGGLRTRMPRQSTDITAEVPSDESSSSINDALQRWRTGDAACPGGRTVRACYDFLRVMGHPRHLCAKELFEILRGQLMSLLTLKGPPTSSPTIIGKSGRRSSTASITGGGGMTSAFDNLALFAALNDDSVTDPDAEYLTRLARTVHETLAYLDVPCLRDTASALLTHFCQPVILQAHETLLARHLMHRCRCCSSNGSTLFCRACQSSRRNSIGSCCNTSKAFGEMTFSDGTNGSFDNVAPYCCCFNGTKKRRSDCGQPLLQKPATYPSQSGPRGTLKTVRSPEAQGISDSHLSGDGGEGWNGGERWNGGEEWNGGEGWNAAEDAAASDCELYLSLAEGSFSCPIDLQQLIKPLDGDAVSPGSNQACLFPCAYPSCSYAKDVRNFTFSRQSGRGPIRMRSDSSSLCSEADASEDNPDFETSSFQAAEAVASDAREIAFKVLTAIIQRSFVNPLLNQYCRQLGPLPFRAMLWSLRPSWVLQQAIPLIHAIGATLRVGDEQASSESPPLTELVTIANSSPVAFKTIKRFLEALIHDGNQSTVGTDDPADAFQLLAEGAMLPPVCSRDATSLAGNTAVKKQADLDCYVAATRTLVIRSCTSSKFGVSPEIQLIRLMETVRRHAARRDAFRARTSSGRQTIGPDSSGDLAAEEYPPGSIPSAASTALDVKTVLLEGLKNIEIRFFHELASASLILLHPPYLFAISSLLIESQIFESVSTNILTSPAGALNQRMTDTILGLLTLGVAFPVLRANWLRKLKNCKGFITAENHKLQRPLSLSAIALSTMRLSAAAAAVAGTAGPGMSGSVGNVQNVPAILRDLRDVLPRLRPVTVKFLRLFLRALGSHIYTEGPSTKEGELEKTERTKLLDKLTSFFIANASPGIKKTPDESAAPLENSVRRASTTQNETPDVVVGSGVRNPVEDNRATHIDIPERPSDNTSSGRLATRDLNTGARNTIPGKTISPVSLNKRLLKALVPGLLHAGLSNPKAYRYMIDFAMDATLIFEMDESLDASIVQYIARLVLTLGTNSAITPADRRLIFRRAIMPPDMQQRILELLQSLNRFRSRKKRKPGDSVDPFSGPRRAPSEKRRRLEGPQDDQLHRHEVLELPPPEKNDEPPEKIHDVELPSLPPGSALEEKQMTQREMMELMSKLTLRLCGSVVLLVEKDQKVTTEAETDEERKPATAQLIAALDSHDKRVLGLAAEFAHTYVKKLPPEPEYKILRSTWISIAERLRGTASHQRRSIKKLPQYAKKQELQS